MTRERIETNRSSTILKIDFGVKSPKAKVLYLLLRKRGDNVIEDRVKERRKDHRMTPSGKTVTGGGFLVSRILVANLSGSSP